MGEKTLIKGKDKDLESSIAFMQSQLVILGFDIEEVSWLNPVQGVYSAVSYTHLTLPTKRIV